MSWRVFLFSTAGAVVFSTTVARAQNVPRKSTTALHEGQETYGEPRSTWEVAQASPPVAGASAPAASTEARPAPAPAATGANGEPLPNLPIEPTVDISDTREDPNQKYYFIGLRYRGTVIPQFLLNLFVDDGATIYSNSIGAEFDIRSGSNSLIPWIAYTDYNTGDIMFLQKGQQDIASNRSVVNSSLKAVYLGLDELWSVPIAPNKLDFEFGFGVGIGAVFGSLMNNWVYQTSATGAGTYSSSNGNNYALCTTTTPGPYPLAAGADDIVNGCSPANHTSSNPAKIGHYVEPNWLNGGSVPVVFPYISIPQIGLRYKPIKQFETRLSLGLSLTGIWFGLSADYGLEKTTPEPSRNGRVEPHSGDTL